MAESSALVTEKAVIVSEAAWHKAQVDALIARVFGPGRLVKTAERLREGSQPLNPLCFVAERPTDANTNVVGAVRLWPVRVRAEDDALSPVFAFLGPIAVDPAFQGEGLGKTLVAAALEASDRAGYEAVILVGAHSYFQPFGFEPAQGLSLPGPADPKRLLVRAAYPLREGRVEIAPQGPADARP